MVQLITNVPAYENDIAEEIRLFLGAVEVRPDATDEDGNPATDAMTITLDEETATASGTLGTASALFPVSPDGGDILERKRQQKRAVKRVAYALLQKAYPMDMPWGSLTGIRPTKLLRELAGRYGDEEAVRQFREVFSVSLDKLRLAATINAVQKPYIESVGPRDLDDLLVRFGPGNNFLIPDSSEILMEEPDGILYRFDGRESAIRKGYGTYPEK